MSPPEPSSFFLNLRRRNNLSRDFKILPRVSTISTSRYTTLISGMFMLLMLIGSVLGSQPQISSDLFLNRLNISFGINYKYSGLLHYSIDRVWIVTKVTLPKLEDIHFPDIAFDPDCAFIKSLKHSRTAALQVENIRSICRSMKPIINLMKGKELYYENAIKNILQEEIPRSLHGSRHRHVSRSNQDPVSAGQRFSCSTNRETPVRKKKASSALIPAIAGLATIAVESLNSFLQRKIKPWLKA